MDHLRPYQARSVVPLPQFDSNAWRLKRYAIIAPDRSLDRSSADAASVEAINRLPPAGTIESSTGNHGIGFQLIHFAEIAVVAPTFYWLWGSVLANLEQLRAPLASPTTFDTGVTEVLGCVWEMDIVSYEISCWKSTVLSDSGHPYYGVLRYLEQHAPSDTP